MKTYNWKENIREEQLDNGSCLYKIKDESIPIIYFKLVIKQGALNEKKEEKGITSLLSQMLLIGNKHFNQEALNLELDKIGASLNIASGYDYFVFLSRVPSEYFSQFLKILQRVLFEAISFDEEQFDIAKAKAKNLLLRIKEDDNYLSSMILSNILFQNKNYGLLSSGNTETLDRLNIKSLSSRLEELKNSDHFWLIGGDINEEHVLALKSFSNQFSIMKKEETPEIEQYKPEGVELYYYQKEDRNKVNTVIGAPSVALNSQDIYPALLFNKYFGSDFTSIMAQEIREKNGWSYYANSEFSLYKHATLFNMEYAPDLEHIAESIAYLHRLFKSHLTCIDEEHLTFTKKKILNSYYFKFSTTVKKLSLLSDLKLYQYPEAFFNTYESWVQEADGAKLQKHVKRFIQPENQVVVMVGDIDSKLDELKELQLFSKIVKLEDLEYLR